MTGSGGDGRSTGFDLATALGVARSVLIYHARPRRRAALARFYRGFLAEGDLAFDIGAHVGHRALAMRRAGARIVAVEPQPAFARLLRATLGRRGVVIVAAAVGAEEGETELRISRLHPTVSSGSEAFRRAVAGDPSFDRVSWDRTIRVPVTTLDRLVAQHGVPRFVKIDVEGMEPEILTGLSHPVPIVAFEMLPAAAALAAAARRRLSALSPAYRFNAILGEGTRFAAPGWVDADGAGDLLQRIAAAGGHADIYAALPEALPAMEDIGP